MFSAKNYGLPKDLIEAAKRVHEKQLEEQQKPTSLRQAVGRVGLAIRGVIPKRATKPSPEEVYKAMGGTKPKRANNPKNNDPDFTELSKVLNPVFDRPPLPERKPKPKNEEVQFTEEELAEAFAIFLEENFHVEMLTEEDLDYVFEEEFPQWLEEQEKRSLMGRVLDYLPGYTSTRKELKRKAGQSVSQNLQDFAREIPNTLLAASPAGRAKTALRLAAPAARKTVEKSYGPEEIIAALKKRPVTNPRTRTDDFIAALEQLPPRSSSVPKIPKKSSTKASATAAATTRNLLPRIPQEPETPEPGSNQQSVKKSQSQTQTGKKSALVRKNRGVSLPVRNPLPAFQVPRDEHELNVKPSAPPIKPKLLNPASSSAEQSPQNNKQIPIPTRKPSPPPTTTPQQETQTTRTRPKKRTKLKGYAKYKQENRIKGYKRNPKAYLGYLKTKRKPDWKERVFEPKD